MSIQQTELNELVEALKLGQEKALEIMAATGAEVFGLSFRPDGHVEKQFLITKIFGNNALIDTYSWIDGGYYSTEKVDVDFLKSHCALYVDEEKWREVAGTMGQKAIKP